jgi:hypothetical protein
VDFDGRGFDRREPPREHVGQGGLDREGRPVLNHQVREAGDGAVALRREGLHPQLGQEALQHVLHERREPRAREPVVERLVGDPDAILVIESPQQVGQRFDPSAAQRRDHRQEQPVRRYRPQPKRLAGVAANLIDLVHRQRARQGVTESGKLRRRQGWHRRFLRWLVWQPQHEAVDAPCRSPLLPERVSKDPTYVS